MPHLKMEILAASTTTVGTSTNVECSVSAVPYLIASPHIELFGPEQIKLSTASNLSLTHTLDPVKTWNAGLYMCSAVLEIDAANIFIEFQSGIHALSVRRKLLILHVYLTQFYKGTSVAQC